MYALMKVTMDGNVIRSVRSEGTFDADNEVERIVGRMEKAPTRRDGKEERFVDVRVVEEGKSRDVEFLYNDKTKMMTIRKPLVKVTGEWMVEIS